MKVALVGFSGSELDSIVLEHLISIIGELTKVDEIDFIDLRRGRDFLKEENKKYDIVVLNYIFILSEGEFKKEITYEFFKNDWTFRTSPLHNKENWRKRLLQSEAKEIYMFENSEVNGKWIGPLEGYSNMVISEPDGNIWVYKKK